jgi:thiamine biosynthesis lipoprotein
LKLFLPALLAFMTFLLGCSQQVEKAGPELTELTGQALGTTWTVKVLTERFIDQRDLRHSILKTLDDYDKIFSHWRPDSELYQFNSAITTSAISIHPELLELLKHSQWMYRETTGAFDPTVAPLVNLWGFGPSGKNPIHDSI